MSCRRLWLQVLRGRWNYRDGDAGTRLLDAVEGLLGRWETLAKEFRRQGNDLEGAREALKLFDALAAAVEAGEMRQALALTGSEATIDPRPQWRGFLLCVKRHSQD